jgi:hypothetical protein
MGNRSGDLRLCESGIHLKLFITKQMAKMKDKWLGLRMFFEHPIRRNKVQVILQSLS